MKAALCEIVRGISGAQDQDEHADNIHEDGNGYRGQKKNGSGKVGFEPEIGKKGSQKEERHHGSESAAGLDNLHGPIWKMNDIPFSVYGDPKIGREPDTRLRDKEL